MRVDERGFPIGPLIKDPEDDDVEKIKEKLNKLRLDKTIGGGREDYAHTKRLKNLLEWLDDNGA